MNHDDAGVTLIELLITITILGVIIGALGGGLIVAFRFTGETKNRLATSHDAQITAAYFAADMASAETVGTGLSCGSEGTPVMSMEWTDPGSDASDTDDDVEITVSYVVVQESGETQVVRRLCEDGVEDSTAIMAHLLDPDTAPSVTCAPAPCTAASTSASTSAEMTVTACVLAPSGACRLDEDPYVFSVSGTRRAT